MRGIDRLAAAIAAHQHGLVSVAQLRRDGASSALITRRCRSGAWRRAAPGVIALGGAPVTFDQRVMAAVLSIGEPVVVSHRTAARVWGITPPGATPIEVSVPRERRVRRPGLIVHRVRDLHLAAPEWRHGYPVTGLARTLLDLGAVAPKAVRAAVWAGFRDHGLGWLDLEEVLAEHGRAGRDGLGPLRRIVADHLGEAARDSATEVLVERILAASGRIPPPVAQLEVTCADGVTVHVDFGWPRYRAVVEVFGVDHLTNEDLAQLDAHRRNQIELAGWRMLVVTGRRARAHPDRVVAEVEQLLRAGGWRG